MAIESILHKILKPALGCTEAVAISLGVAAAVMATEGWSPQNPHIPMKTLAVEDVESVRVAMNKGIFKNAFSIYIPNAGGDKGILIAAALGAWCDPSLGLELFRDLAHEDVVRGTSFISTTWTSWMALLSWTSSPTCRFLTHPFRRRPAGSMNAARTDRSPPTAFIAVVVRRTH